MENQKETETKHTDCIAVDNDSIIEDFIRHDNDELVEVYQDGRDIPAVSDEHEVVELDKEEMPLAELNTRFPSFNSEKCTESFDEPLASDSEVQRQVGDNGVLLDEGCLCEIVEDKAMDANESSTKMDENGGAPSKFPETKRKNESNRMKSQKVSTKVQLMTEFCSLLVDCIYSFAFI